MKTMTTAHLKFLTCRRPVKVAHPHSPLIRQWQLVEWLSSEPEGVTAAEAAEAAGVDVRTIRRDLILLRKVGFDLEEAMEDHGRKRWRIRQPYERLRSKRQRYRAIREGLDRLLTQAENVGDKRLLKDLEAIRRRVVRRCST